MKCPRCGETERLRGRRTEGDIVVQCEACGTQWMRGDPRCKRCGQAGSITAPQLMTRHPRGTLLSVVGKRQTQLCPRCDHEVLKAATEHGRPVPEGYVSRFLFGDPTPTGAPLTSPSPRKPQSKPRAAPIKAPESRPAPRAQKSAPKPAATPTDPTVRQATEAFLNRRAGDWSGLTMLLLGKLLGPSTRLSSLDNDMTPYRLATWLTETFGARAAQQTEAAETIRQVSAYWREQGWVSRDLASQLESVD